MKVVREYTLLISAQLAQLELRSHGIDCVILDEHMASLAPFFALDGGIRLAVSDEDYSQSVELLENLPPLTG